MGAAARGARWGPCIFCVSRWSELLRPALSSAPSLPACSKRLMPTLSLPCLELRPPIPASITGVRYTHYTNIVGLTLSIL